MLTLSQAHHQPRAQLGRSECSAWVSAS
jgi:hypothetical protein